MSGATVPIAVVWSAAAAAAAVAAAFTVLHKRGTSGSCLGYPSFSYAPVNITW